MASWSLATECNFSLKSSVFSLSWSLTSAAAHCAKRLPNTKSPSNLRTTTHRPSRASTNYSRLSPCL